MRIHAYMYVFIYTCVYIWRAAALACVSARMTWHCPHAFGQECNDREGVAKSRAHKPPVLPHHVQVANARAHTRICTCKHALMHAYTPCTDGTHSRPIPDVWGNASAQTQRRQRPGPKRSKTQAGSRQNPMSRHRKLRQVGVPWSP